MVEPMKIRTSRCYSDEPYEWSAIDDDTYDGAEDSSNRHMIGFGKTEAEAIADLERLIQEHHEWFEHKAGTPQ
jgi:predicted RNase H-like HicB family nuclease